ncbi:MAG: HNH endonuclease [Candidatus Saccharimonas sp.]|nr:HNH endonuclease [Planctomycetaceae bacterium]
MDAATRATVRERANHKCEYCQLHQDHSPLAPLQIEHIRPKKHRGTDDSENLALACIDCNLAKSCNIAGIDPDSEQLTSLFHPRLQRWGEHFNWQGAFIMGTTAVGRTTVDVLDMNSDDRLELRLLIFADESRGT